MPKTSSPDLGYEQSIAEGPPDRRLVGASAK